MFNGSFINLSLYLESSNILLKNYPITRLGISQPATPPSEPETVEEDVVPFVPRRRDPAQLLQRLEQHQQNRHSGARRSRRANNGGFRRVMALCERDQQISTSFQHWPLSILEDFGSFLSRLFQYA